MHIDYFLSVFKKNSKKDSIIWKNKNYSYGWLIDKYDVWCSYLAEKDILRGSVVVIQADFSPNSIALLLALVEREAILVPVTKSIQSKKDEFIRVAQAEIIIEITDDDVVTLNHFNKKSEHYLYKVLKKKKKPGLVLFSSGSTGESKASVHDLTNLLQKFMKPKQALVTITFLLYDHIGGFNTLFYILSNAGLIVTVDNRSPVSVLNLVEKYKVELLPTSPTFLNLILISGEYKNYNLSTLKIITYGTEPMPQTTLEKFNLLFPKIKFKQTYGLSEVGILQSKSESSDSLWLKVGGRGSQTRIVDNMLEIKSKSAMLGYLNAKSPFTNDGWFRTGDKVEIKGEHIKILGRESEIINVGGEKVYPQEVENILLKLKEVKDVTVFGEKNQIIGNIVCAEIELINNLKNQKDFEKRMKQYCINNLEKYKVPIKFIYRTSIKHNPRFKKKRT